ncbi:hypothetical protein KC19_12G169100 [Ceratodon purpureus]|uniref:Uncharacterized protein n=1 Tax=Ceratodon purpureus TaxID=3225 RepID=A0A8T0GAE6_CERPU|nr:hypothetical protein KC19_12G169100 [Ceratodon purpureus]
MHFPSRFNALAKKQTHWLFRTTYRHARSQQTLADGKNHYGNASFTSRPGCENSGEKIDFPSNSPVTVRPIGTRRPAAFKRGASS